MTKHIFGIFAHPDDEAFGPAGTLLMEAKSGTKLHLICLTGGEGGTNPDSHDDLGAVRLKEWHEAAALLGATSTHHLGYADGSLCNNNYHEVARRVEAVIDAVLDEHKDADSIELLCFDLNGITGHLDHILASRVACYVYYERQRGDARFKRLRLYCLPKDSYSDRNTDWLYMEAGRDADDIDEIIDAREYKDEILAIMKTHHSQRGDADSQINKLGDLVAVDHFIVLG